MYKQQEALCQELGDKAGLARSLFNQSNLLAEKMNQLEEGLCLAEEAYKIATENHFDALAQQIKPILESIKAKVD